MTNMDTQFGPPLGGLPGDPWVAPIAPPPPTAAPLEIPADTFHDWARQWVDATAPAVERKAAEYGSNSLAKKGWRMANAQHRAVEQAEALELGALQYVLEKLDRVEDSMLRGQTPSDDTLLDATVYLLMVLFVRQNGHWI